MNLTPRIIDVLSQPPGLSLTTTAGSGWVFHSGKRGLVAVGFVLEDDPRPDDPGHFVLRPGPLQVVEGLTLQAWAETRDGIDELDPLTWYPLTTLLRGLASRN